MRTTSLLAATGLFTTGLLTTQPAQAIPAHTDATSCSIILPAQISLRRAKTVVTVPQAANCAEAGVKSAKWVGEKAGDPVTEPIWFTNFARQSTLELFDNVSPVGVVPFVGKGAQNGDGDAIAQTNATTTIKFASSASITGARRGTRTTIGLTVGYYNPKARAFVRWPNKQVAIQYRASSRGPWTGLKSVTTNKVGQASYTYYPGKTRYYRIYVPANTSIWQFYSATIAR